MDLSNESVKPQDDDHICPTCGISRKRSGRKRLTPEEALKRVAEHREKMRLRYWQKKELLERLSAQVASQAST